MKKFSLIVAAVLLLSCLGFAQKGLLIGLRGGVGASMFINKQDSDEPDDVYQVKSAGLAGLSVFYNFSETIGVGTSLGFSFLRTGWEVDYGIGTLYSITHHANYFNLPIYLQFSGDPDNTVTGFFYIGPEFNFLMSVNQTSDIPNPLFWSAPTSAELKEFKSYHSGMVFGAGLGGGVNINVAESFRISLGVGIGGNFTDMYKAKDFKSIQRGTNPVTYASVSEEGFNVDPTTGKRDVTYQVKANFEIGVTYIIGK